MSTYPGSRASQTLSVRRTTKALHNCFGDSIVSMWLSAITFTIAAVAGVAILAIIYGAFRWRAGTATLRALLTAGRQPISPTRFDPKELEDLPEPVQRYFRKVLKAGQPMVAAARVLHEGEFNLGKAAPKWMRFTSTQLVISRRPGFDWDARMRMAPGVYVLVHDAYVAGEGLLHAALAGLVSLASVRGTPEVARGELMRFLAEAAWYPTALLPSQGVHWQAIDDTSARASLSDGVTTVTLEFQFDAQGLITIARAAARDRLVDGQAVPASWLAHVWGYELREGMLVPLRGEVAWILPDGPAPYWRARITDVAYELTS